MKYSLMPVIFWAVAGSACSEKATGNSVIQDPPEDTTVTIAVKDCKKCILLSEQSQHRVAIVDAEGGKIIWEWKPEQSNVKKEHYTWFTNISDAKPVYDGKYILTTASGGGVALIRISDKKAVFYAYAGGNTHSAELLPDGNIVSASSTGNFLTVFKMDSALTPENVYSKNIPIAFGHNVVWDHQRQLLWSAGMDKLIAFRYNFNCSQPDLEPEDTISTPGTEAHDLFPIYGTDSLWLTNKTNVYKFAINAATFTQPAGLQKNIKSVSSGPADFPVIVILPKEQWWTDEVLDITGKSIFKLSGLRIYKARWLVNNAFSYPAQDHIKQCQ